jgi:hypothetical protein
MAGNLVGSRRIKSIQRGLTNFDGTVTQVDATITSVVTANTIVRIIGLSGGGDIASRSTANIEIINSTTIRMFKAELTNQLQVHWEVIEFENVKSKQTGKVNLGNGSTVTITSVNTSKSLVFSSVKNGATSAGSIRADSGLVLTSATQLTFRTSYTSGTTEVAWQVIEFN